MDDAEQSKDARLTVRSLGVASCLRVGVIAGAGIGIVVFLVTFLGWQMIVPAVLQAVDAAFAGSRALLGGVLGPGQGLVVSALIGLSAAVLAVLASVLVPLFYTFVARRTGGVRVVLAPGE
ncbi:DUF3566 domain-containing protein [Amnibacterium sp.]|uniref:DUF3566 domain-containing protein n=1 Tax=Amnibacterium sp. TaxID=1872496 RepID=UPI00261489F9|nr:DUF3566 domain-containing protein [Amnibacterium sp.]MCU1473264.1 hypothetical protein [Amnibacterium sp.]